MSSMATLRLPPESLYYAAPSGRGVPLPSFPCSHRRLQFSWRCHSSLLLPPIPSLPTSAAATLCKLRYGVPETDQTGLSHGGSKQIEVLEQVNLHSSFGLVLQWTLALETRRSFITGSVQQLSNSILSCCPRPLSTPQPGIMSRRDKFARRIALMIPFLITAGTSCNSFAQTSGTEETRNPGSSFLQNFGIGERDLYYPSIFAGSWVCNSTLVAVDTPQGEDKADLKSVEFAQSMVGSNVVDHGIWTPQQPDRLTLILRGGLKVQNVVTKRAASLLGPGQFDTSEYSQQIFDNYKLEGGPPTIKASQNRTRYRWDATNKDVSYIEAFQRVSMFPVIQEGLTNMDLMNLDKPVAVYKYIVRFTKEAS